MDKQKKEIVKQRIYLYGGVLVMLLVCVGFIQAYRYLTISKYGTELSPKQDVQPVSMRFFAQSDPMYGDERMGEMEYTMKEQGSLLCCIAMAASHMGEEISPKDLNIASMYEGEAFQVEKLGDFIPGVKFSSQSVFDEESILAQLQAGIYPMLRYGDDSGVHWVLLVGAQDGRFLCLDPRGDGAPAPFTQAANLLAYIEINQ